MATIADLQRLGALNQGLAVISMLRPDGTVHSTVVNAGVMRHPVLGNETVALVLRGDAWKRRLLRESGRASVVVRHGWEWAGVEGPVDIIGPDDPFEGFAAADLPQLLRAIFTAAGGTHDDWDEYDRVMAAERRTAVFIHPERVLGNVN